MWSRFPLFFFPSLQTLSFFLSPLLRSIMGQITDKDEDTIVLIDPRRRFPPFLSSPPVALPSSSSPQQVVKGLGECSRESGTAATDAPPLSLSTRIFSPSFFSSWSSMTDEGVEKAEKTLERLAPYFSPLPLFR